MLDGKDKFVILRPSLKYDLELVKERIKGDIDNDDEITMVDLRLLLQNIINYNGDSKKTPDNMDILDINEDGELNVLDIRVLLQEYINNDQ